MWIQVLYTGRGRDNQCLAYWEHVYILQAINYYANNYIMLNPHTHKVNVYTAPLKDVHSCGGRIIYMSHQAVCYHYGLISL